MNLSRTFEIAHRAPPRRPRPVGRAPALLCVDLASCWTLSWLRRCSFGRPAPSLRQGLRCRFWAPRIRSDTARRAGPADARRDAALARAGYRVLRLDAA